MNWIKKTAVISVLLLCSLCKGKKEESTPVNQNTIYTSSKKVENIHLDNYVFNTVHASEEKITLEAGKKYILDFWYLECMPCVRDHKLIAKKVDSLKHQNVEVVSLSIDRDTKKWRTYLAEHSYEWKNYNQYAQEPNLKEDLELKLYPTYLLVDASGKVYQKTNAFQKMLDDLSKEE
jgi:cytochrome oxidase Cu insertion factor (SCO1/SenC/PrrC family)